MKDYRFYMEADHRWYIDLPKWEGPKDALEMVAGADTMLNIMSQGEGAVTLRMSESEFNGSDLLEFIKEADDCGEGAYYMMKEFEGIDFNLEMWLCDVTKFVFGYFPEKIWITKIN